MSNIVPKFQEYALGSTAEHVTLLTPDNGEPTQNAACPCIYIPAGTTPECIIMVVTVSTRFFENVSIRPMQSSLCGLRQGNNKRFTRAYLSTYEGRMRKATK